MEKELVEKLSGRVSASQAKGRVDHFKRKRKDHVVICRNVLCKNAER